jgi:hypothetical protein
MSVSRRADLQLTDLICYGTLHVPLMRTSRAFRYFRTICDYLGRAACKRELSDDREHGSGLSAATSGYFDAIVLPRLWPQ